MPAATNPELFGYWPTRYAGSLYILLRPWTKTKPKSEQLKPCLRPNWDYKLWSKIKVLDQSFGLRPKS